MVADEYFGFINDVIGVLALSLGAAALSFEHPEPFAWFFLVVLILWAASKGTEYKRVAKRYLEQYRGVVGTVVLVWKIRIYLIGFGFLSGIALKVITKSGIYALFGYHS